MRILVTRPAAQAGELAVLLAERGFDAVAVPTVAVEAADLAPLHAALSTPPDWLVVTSANGAGVLGSTFAVPPETRVAAVGPATARALRARGIRVDHVPDRYLTVAIAEGLGDLSGRRVVLARADAATPDLREALLARGAHVEEVVTYRTIEGPASSRTPLRTALASDVDGITFTSASTVRGLLALTDAITRHRVAAMPGFCIGPVTAGTAMRAGLRVVAVAREHTVGGLAAAIADHFSQESI